MSLLSLDAAPARLQLVSSSLAAVRATSREQLLEDAHVEGVVQLRVAIASAAIAITTLQAALEARAIVDLERQLDAAQATVEDGLVRDSNWPLPADCTSRDGSSLSSSSTRTNGACVA